MKTFRSNAISISVGLIAVVTGMTVPMGEVSAQGSKIGGGVPELSRQIEALQEAVMNQPTKSETTAQHDMIKANLADVETELARRMQEVKELVEVLEPGGAPPCGPGTEALRFVVNGLEVCDNTTGLYWEQSPSTSFFTWDSAKNVHCPNLDLGNGKVYRLPVIKELISLLDHSQSGPPLPIGHPFGNVGPSASYWSAQPSVDFLTEAWYVRFPTGLLLTASMALVDGPLAWCVR